MRHLIVRTAVRGGRFSARRSGREEPTVRVEESAWYGPRVDTPQAAPAGLERGLWGQAGGVVAGAALAMGRGASAAYRAVDPDLRWHLAQLPLLGLTLLGPRRGTVEPRPDDGCRPLVFVHGLGGHRGNFLPMQVWLRAKGRRRLYACGLTPGGTVEELAVELRAYLEEVLQVNGLPEGARVDLVAHSMGGVVARCALEDPATARRVATLVTLGTPHGGSHAARYLATPVLLSLRPGSPLMTRLAERTPWSGPTRLVCFWSRADVLLLPATTASVQGAENHELDGVTHYGYLLRADCWRRVLESLS